MNIMLAGFIGGWEMILILAVVLVLFGAKKVPELARGLGQGIKEFKKATREVTDELQNTTEDSAPPARRLTPPTTVASTTASEPDRSAAPASTPTPASKA